MIDDQDFMKEHGNNKIAEQVYMKEVGERDHNKLKFI